MASLHRAANFSLLDEAWIPVLGASGRRRDVSLRGLFEQAGDIRMMACELPSQTFAVLRLALAILHRVTDGPAGEAAWRALWRDRRLPLRDLADYLAQVGERFDLLHPTQPFYQVPDLQPGKETTFGLERIIADVPNNAPYLTSRAGPGIASVTPAEAALWLVHCQAFDPSGIKTGAVGDTRVKGGRGYPIGVSSAGSLGGVHLEGADLFETLMLNLIPFGAGHRTYDERDEPVWERPPLSAAEQPVTTRGPYGVLGLYTWQSRRIRLFGDDIRITGAMISNGDPIEWQDRHLLEPMSVWGRSAPREKQQKREPIYLPRQHDHTRALWRGLQTLLPPAPPAGQPAQRLSPLVLQWLAHLNVVGAVGADFAVRQRATTVVYGTQQAVIDNVYGDALTMNVQVLVDGSPLRNTAVDAAADAESAVKELGALAANLIRAAGGAGSETGAADRAAERAYAALDRQFRDWLASLGPASEPATARAQWQRSVRHELLRLGAELVESAGPAAWAGRTVNDRNGKQVHYSTSQSEAWFRGRLARALPLAFDHTNEKQEVPS